jgi:tRNA pseudouridine55 synthase
MNTLFDQQVLLVNKPLTWTSFDVVNKLRYAGKFKKVGHAGTLDPLATGLLIICTGKKTKEIDTYQAQHKEYTGTILLGSSRPSLDLETEIDQHYPTDHIKAEDLENARKSFLGKISQIPPLFSAIKVNGKRAYTAARSGQELELKPREVEILYFEIDHSQFPSISFVLGCSKGTYVRSLARDFGLKLGSGAHLTSLVRTKIGDFELKNAYELDDLINQIKNSNEDLPKTS